LETEPTASPEGNATSSALECAICGEPIVPGQARGPDENDDIVHVDCREATGNRRLTRRLSFLGQARTPSIALAVPTN